MMPSASSMGFNLLTDLHKERERQGLSKTDLAARVGASRSNFSRMEDGIHSPTFSTLMRWASALGMTIRATRDTPAPAEGSAE